MDIKAVKKQYQKYLLSLPNVISLGVGPKIHNGIATGETAIKVFVSKKIGSDELNEQDCVPSHLDGVPTDVVVLGPSNKY